MVVSIIGGGAIGSYLAYQLTGHGIPCELVVKPHQMDHFQDGVRLLGRKFARVHPVKVVTEVSETSDRVIVAVKLPDLESTVKTLADVSGTAARSYLFLQNGLVALDLAAQYLPIELLYGGVALFAVNSLQLGTVQLSQKGPLVVGGLQRGGTAALKQWQALLSSSLKVLCSRDIRAVQRLKLVLNLNNGLAAATGLSLQELYAYRAGVVLSLRLMREGLECFQALKLSLAAPDRRGHLLLLIPHLPERLAVVLMRRMVSQALPREPIYLSALQSILRGRTSEVPALNGEVVRMAQRIGRSAPYNQAVMEAVQKVEASGRPPQFFPLVALFGQANRQT